MYLYYVGCCFLLFGCVVVVVVAVFVVIVHVVCPLWRAPLFLKHALTVFVCCIAECMLSFVLGFGIWYLVFGMCEWPLCVHLSRLINTAMRTMSWVTRWPTHARSSTHKIQAPKSNAKYQAPNSANIHHTTYTNKFNVQTHT